MLLSLFEVKLTSGGAVKIQARKGNKHESLKW